ncbi:MAG: hypothetical protein V2I43_21660, partial [Parvularcula sp.]|nr:hypothetical protein [Parvularcula sp.]
MHKTNSLGGILPRPLSKNIENVEPDSSVALHFFLDEANFPVSDERSARKFFGERRMEAPPGIEPGYT